MGLLRLARIAGIFSGTVAGAIIGTWLLNGVFDVSGSILTVVIGGFWGAVWGAKFIGTKFHPAFIGGTVGGVLMAGTMFILEFILGTAALAYKVTLLSFGISISKIIPGMVVIFIVVPLLPGTE
ncbi:hypothetical protein [Halovenus amylolytica]|uniref:hypothetical protein n=1 Tax=Halovenus amylolytica TaxID=2500550 RepID=UPI00360D5044